MLKQRLQHRAAPQTVVDVSVEAKAPYLLRRYERNNLTVVVEYEDNADFGRVPKRWKATELSSDGKSVANDITVQVEKVALNCHFDETAFDVEFPPGTVVRDASKSEIVTFFVRPVGSHRGITSAEWKSGLDYNQLAGRGPGELAGRLDNQKGEKTTMRWFIGLNVGLVTLIGIGVWVDRRRRIAA